MPLNYKLGKKIPKRDSRNLKLARYIKKVAAPPASGGYLRLVQNWPMDLNDQLGDCVCAAVSHSLQQWTTYAQVFPAILSDKAVEQIYCQACGYQPPDPSTDQGCYILDVLRFGRNQGFAGHRLAAFVEVNHQDPVEMMQAIQLFGNVILGLALPLSAQDARTDPNGYSIFEVSSDPNVNQPGGWGGHCVIAGGYKAPGPGGGLRIVNWGGLWDMTWNFLAAYADEAYAALSQEWIKSSGLAPSGFDFFQLNQDLAAIGIGPVEIP